MKKKLAYLLVCSPNLGFAAGNVALGINKYSSQKDYDILVYHTGLHLQDKQAFKKIPHVRLVNYQLPEKFIKDVMPRLPKGRWNNPNSMLSFAHYEVFNLLDKYHKVIWLDVDVSIQGDLSELERFEGIAIPYDAASDGVFNVRHQFNQNIAGFNMTPPSHCNAVIVVSDTLNNYQQLYRFCWETSKTYAPCFNNPDQAVFELMYQTFNFQPKVVPWLKFCCFSTNKMAHIAHIVHFGTETKVWNTNWLLQSFPEWYRTHLRWLELGGSDFDSEGLDVSNIAPTYETLLHDINKMRWPKWMINMLCWVVPKEKNRRHIRAKYIRTINSHKN